MGLYILRHISYASISWQELRKLVRKVHSIQERQATTEENEKEADAAVMAARKSLTRFLLSLAKHMPSD